MTRALWIGDPGLLKTARENLSLGVGAIVVGPLSREVRDHRLADRAWLGVEDGVRVRIVWVHLDEAEARRRIQARGNPNDAWKLAHWDDYRTRLSCARVSGISTTTTAATPAPAPAANA